MSNRCSNVNIHTTRNDNGFLRVGVRKHTLEWVVIGNLFDQIDLFLRYLWPTKGRPALSFPIQFEALLMPSDDGFGFDDQQRPFPGIVDISQNAEEEPIRYTISSWS